MPVSAALDAPAGDWPGPRSPYAAAVVPRLQDTTVLRIAGRDARAFLSRQLTCDLSHLVPGRVLCGAWLTPKGRAVALLHLVVPEGADDVLAVLPESLADGVCRRLRMFVLRDQVGIEPAGGLVVAGVLGAAVEAAGAGRGAAALPALADLPGDGPLALLVGAAAEVDGLIQVCTEQGAEIGDDNLWRLHRVASALPDVVPGTQEQFVPQMLNLDRIGAVSFSKGCYPGQEIVARTQHLGRIKRRMFRAVSDRGPLPEPGTAVVTGDGDGAGRVVTAARAADGTLRLLAVLALDAVARAEVLHLVAASGPVLQIVAPPYPLAD